MAGEKGHFPVFTVFMTLSDEVLITERVSSSTLAV